MRPAVQEKKKKVSATLSQPVLQQQTHIRLISWSKPIRDSEVRTPKLLSMMHFCYSHIRSAIAHVEEFQHAQHESLVYDRREN